MRSARTIAAGCGLLLAAAALAAEPDYAAMLRSHETRMALLEQGVNALPPLLEIAVGSDRGLAAEAERMARWLAVRANDAPDARAAMAKALLETADKSKSLPVRKLAVSLLARCGRDGAVPLLLAMATAPELAAAACDALAQIPGNAATKALMGAFSKAKDEPRLLLGKALAARRDPAAVAVVATMLDDEALREAAFESLARTPGVAACKELARAIDKAEPAFRARALRVLGRRQCREALTPALTYASEKHKVERLAAVEALGRLRDRTAIAVLLEATKAGDPAVKAAALTAYRRLADSLVAEKPDEAAKMLAYLLPLVATDGERIAALGGLRRARQPASVPAVTPLLAASDWRLSLSAAHALAAIPGAEATEAMRRALKTAGPKVRAALLAALAARKAAAAVPDIAALAADPDERVQIAAMQALAAIAAPEAEPAIRQAIDKGSPAVRTAAAQAYVALAEATIAKGDAPSARAILHQILALAVGEQPTLGALAAVARIPAAESAAAVEPHLKGPRAVRDAAARAYLAIATAIAATGDRKDAAAMLARICELKPPAACAGDAALRLRAIGVQVAIPARNGVVSHWWILGAWAADAQDWPKPRFPEKAVDLLKPGKIGDREVRWKPHRTDDPEGAVALDALVTPTQRAVAYAFAEIHVAQEQEATLEIASDDGCVLWINAKKIYEHLQTRSWGAPPDTVKAQLAAGANRLLLKACQGSGTWAFRLRIRGANGKPLAFKMR